MQINEKTKLKLINFDLEPCNINNDGYDLKINATFLIVEPVKINKFKINFDVI